MPVVGAGDDLKAPVGCVVADRVVDQVADQAFEQSWIAIGCRRVKRRVGLEVELCDPWL